MPHKDTSAKKLRKLYPYVGIIQIRFRVKDTPFLSLLFTSSPLSMTLYHFFCKRQGGNQTKGAHKDFSRFSGNVKPLRRTL